jgi:hypothetical protein
LCKAKSGGVGISDSGKTRNYLNRARFEGKELREGGGIALIPDKQEHLAEKRF